MARLFSKKRGRSGSHRPSRKGAPKWVEYKKEEVERLVIKLRQEGLSSADIGRVLRDQYGIPLVKQITKEKITKILKRNKLEQKIPEDLLNLVKRVVKIQEHMAKNRKDYHSKRGLTLTESKIRRLVKYYKQEKVLPEDFKYEADKAKLLIQ